jgi:hypothetical protein
MFTSSKYKDKEDLGSVYRSTFFWRCSGTEKATLRGGGGL